MPLAPFATTLDQGAKRLVDVCVPPSPAAAGSSGRPDPGPDAATGQYFSRGKAVQSSDDSRDTSRQEELWELSMKATGIPAGGYFSLSNA